MIPEPLKSIFCYLFLIQVVCFLVLVLGVVLKRKAIVEDEPINEEEDYGTEDRISMELHRRRTLVQQEFYSTNYN